jgi:aspartate kinase
MAGETNRLLALAKELNPDPSPRELDVIASTGEQVSVGLLALALQSLGLKAKSYTGWQVPIVTDAAVHKARHPRDRGGEDPRRPDGRAAWSSSPASRASTTTTTSRRSAAAARTRRVSRSPAALKADECQIYTDVDGVYTHRSAHRARGAAPRHGHLRGDARARLAGSKVLQIRSVEFAGKYKVKLRVLSSFTDVNSTDMGTLITFEEDENMEQAIISGIAFNRDEAKITVPGRARPPGIAFGILGPSPTPTSTST